MNSLTISAEDVKSLGLEDGAETEVCVSGKVKLNDDGSASIEDASVEAMDEEENETPEEEKAEGEGEGEAKGESMGTGGAGGKMHKNPAIAIILQHGGPLPKR
jgi:hypothetical protein